MSTRFRTIGATGVEFPLEDVPALIRALQSGQLAPDGMLFDAQTGRWAPAKDHDAVQGALAALPPTGAPVTLATPPRGQLSSGVSAANAGSVAPTALASRFPTWIGPNWETHYRGPFTRLLAAQQGGPTVAWSWNWAAALVPLWWIYRRLYSAFAIWSLAYGVLSALGTELESQGDDASAVGFLSLGLLVLTGALGNRLLFARGLKYLTGLGSNAPPEAVSQHGKPNVTAVKWILGVLAAIVTLGVLLAAS